MNNNYDLIIAEIIELNIKGYITIEYNEEGINKNNYIIKQNIDANSNKLSKEEMIVLSFLFSNKMEINKMELEEKLRNIFSVYNIQFNALKKVLSERVEKEKIVDSFKNIKLKKTTKIFIKLSIVFSSIIILLSCNNMNSIHPFYIFSCILEQIIIYILLRKVNEYTDKGKIIKYNIEKYKNTISNKEFYTKEHTMQEITKDKEFADSIAMHISTLAKDAFITNIAYREAIKASSKTGISVLGISTILLAILIVIALITISIPKEAAVWIYIIIIIFIACSADIVYALAKKK